MKINPSNAFLIVLAILLNCQHFAIAQSENQAGQRLAQDYFQAVKQTATTPLDPPTNMAMPEVKTVGTNLKAFGVPFKINADNASFIEVQLYLSRDMGKTWKFHTRQSTDQNDFPFQADGDGEYWFSLKTLDRDRRLLPEGNPQAELKIVVDSIDPKLDFRIESDAAGRVVCRWNAEDENLLPESFQIYYQPIGDSGPTKDWQKVPVELNGKARVGVYADQIAWWPETTERQVNVAVEIRDIAGNVAQVQRQIELPQTAWRHRAESVAQITDNHPPPPASQFPQPTGGFSTPPVDPVQLDRLPNADQLTAPEKLAGDSDTHPTDVICEDGVCRKVPMLLIGSEVEYAEPPAPDGNWQFSQPTQNQSPASQSGSVEWESDSQTKLSGNQSSFGTTVGSTFRPDPSLAPQINPLQRVAKPVTEIPSNPATMRTAGDQVIGESSTMGKSNQYRGLNSRDGSPIPAPTLLPGNPGTEGAWKERSQTEYPNTGHAGFERLGAENNLQAQDAQSRAGQPRSRAGEWVQPQTPTGGFSSAGFANDDSTNSQSQAARASSRPIDSREANPTGSRAALQIIGTKRFRLDYGIDAIDPSGVARVDLWMTRDGRNWSTWGNDPDNQSPFPVEVQEEGRYGFRIVVHSKDGLTGQGPSTGDDADIWVLVDTQSPLTRITSVPYGRGNEAGRLVINYSVSDDQLTLRPITLAYAASPQGPWNVIGEGLRNESRYVWKPKSDVPDQIYLKIEALDKAGNVGIHTLSQAIDVSGLVPRGTIRGVSPVGR